MKRSELFLAPVQVLTPELSARLTMVIILSSFYLSLALRQVAFVGIRTQTSASSLDQLVCPGDLVHQPEQVYKTPQPNKPLRVTSCLFRLALQGYSVASLLWALCFAVAFSVTLLLRALSFVLASCLLRLASILYFMLT